MDNQTPLQSYPRFQAREKVEHQDLGRGVIVTQRADGQVVVIFAKRGVRDVMWPFLLKRVEQTPGITAR